MTTADLVNAGRAAGRGAHDVYHPHFPPHAPLHVCNNSPPLLLDARTPSLPFELHPHFNLAFAAESSERQQDANTLVNATIVESINRQAGHACVGPGKGQLVATVKDKRYLASMRG
mmetsp:Transcript_17860/g.45701  ORF Transcript_17860/g.45701 Transcript_17860/m.45701 type:complete len:116 (+) Transcript_17860:857-1204(+)